MRGVWSCVTSDELRRRARTFYGGKGLPRVGGAVGKREWQLTTIRLASAPL
jgi:hypothetical protein